jgi:hypothetical protein
MKEAADYGGLFSFGWRVVWFGGPVTGAGGDGEFGVLREPDLELVQAGFG